jgi:hypothetical protein
VGNAAAILLEAAASTGAILAADVVIAVIEGAQAQRTMIAL